MSYNAHVKINSENISKLPFITGQFVYYLKQDGINTCGILYSVDSDNYKKACDKLTGEDQAEVKQGDYVYLMPGSKIPGFKIKDHVKKCGARMTTDIDKATIFIGNCNIRESITINHQEKAGTLLFHAGFVNEVAIPVDQHDTTKQEQIFNKTDAYNSVILPGERHKYKTLTSKFLTNIIPELNYSVQGNTRFLTPAAVNIIYNSKLKNLPIINENFLLEQIAPSLVIDEDSFESIKSMLYSSNQESVNTGVEIVCNCDIEKSLLYLWKLSKDCYNAVSRAHSKNSRLFIETAKWNKLYDYNAEEFIVYLKDKRLLTKDWCRILIKEASEVYKDSLKSNMFKMVLIPTQEYFDYVDVTDVFEFNHKSNKQARDDDNDDDED